MSDNATLTISIVSAATASFAALFAFWQVKVAERSRQQQAETAERSADLQALIQFRASAMESHYAEGIDLIGEVTANDFDKFKEEFSEEDRRKIRECVEHLNFVANLVLGRHIGQQTAWDIYFMSYRILAQKLNPWWFDAQAKNHPNRFNATRTMMKRVMMITEDDIIAFDKKRNKINGIES